MTDFLSDPTGQPATNPMQEAMAGRMTPEQLAEFQHVGQQSEVLRVQHAERPVQVAWETRKLTEKLALVPSESPMLANQYLELQYFWGLLGLRHNLQIMGEAGKAESDFLGYSSRQLGIENLARLNKDETKALQETVETQIKFFVAMSKLTFLWGRYDANGGAVDKWAEGFLHPTAYQIQTADLAALFREGPQLFADVGQPLPENLRNSEKLQMFGNTVDKVMRAYYAISLCEKPEDFLELMKTPGWEILMDADYLQIRPDLKNPLPVSSDSGNIMGYVEPGGTIMMVAKVEIDGETWYEVEMNDGNRGYIPNGAVAKTIDQKFLFGDPTKWQKDKRRNDEGDNGSVNSLKVNHLAREAGTIPGFESNKSRGILDEKGNPFAHGESLEERNSIRANVLKYIARGDRLAEETAFRLFRLFGMAAEAGSEKYWDQEKGEWKYQQEGFPAGSDDMVKIMDTLAWQKKNTTSKHPCGPDATKGEFDRFAVSFLKFTASKADNFYPGIDSETGNFRSLLEAWWGYSSTDPKLVEPAKKLGEMPWEKMSPDTFRDWMLRIYYAGKKEGGLLSLFTQQDWTADTLMTETFWQNLEKTLNVGIHESVVVNGRFRGMNIDELNKLKGKEKDRLKVSFGKGVVDSPLWYPQGSREIRGFTPNLRDGRYSATGYARGVAQRFGFNIPEVNVDKPMWFYKSNSR